MLTLLIVGHLLQVQFRGQLLLLPPAPSSVPPLVSPPRLCQQRRRLQSQFEFPVLRCFCCFSCHFSCGHSDLVCETVRRVYTLLPCKSRKVAVPQAVDSINQLRSESALGPDGATRRCIHYWKERPIPSGQPAVGSPPGERGGLGLATPGGKRLPRNIARAPESLWRAAPPSLSAPWALCAFKLDARGIMMTSELPWGTIWGSNAGRCQFVNAPLLF